MKREKKTEQPPRLYDLTTLQREANRLFGFTAKQTLDYAQQLYEKKLLTYPRTDSQYLTDDMQPTAESIVSGLWPLLPFAAGLDIVPAVWPGAEQQKGERPPRHYPHDGVCAERL